jgi:hypothetical protein
LLWDARHVLGADHWIHKLGWLVLAMMGEELISILNVVFGESQIVMDGFAVERKAEKP